MSNHAVKICFWSCSFFFLGKKQKQICQEHTHLRCTISFMLVAYDRSYFYVSDFYFAVYVKGCKQRSVLGGLKWQSINWQGRHIAAPVGTESDAVWVNAKMPKRSFCLFGPMATMQCRGVAGNWIMDNLGDNPFIYLRGKFVLHVQSQLSTEPFIFGDGPF